MDPDTELGRICVALANQLRSNIERDINVSPFPFSGMQLDRIEVWPADGDAFVNYFQTQSDFGIADLHLRLRVDISTADPETGFLVMTDLLSWDGPSSIVRAVMLDRSLDGTVDDAVVLQAGWETDEEHQAQRSWLPVQIMLRKGV